MTERRGGRLPCWSVRVPSIASVAETGPPCKLLASAWTCLGGADRSAAIWIGPGTAWRRKIARRAYCEAADQCSLKGLAAYPLLHGYGTICACIHEPMSRLRFRLKASPLRVRDLGGELCVSSTIALGHPGEVGLKKGPCFDIFRYG